MAVKKRKAAKKKKAPKGYHRMPNGKLMKGAAHGGKYSSVKSAVKRKFKVYPSAYANAFLVKEYKRRGGKYRMGVKK